MAMSVVIQGAAKDVLKGSLSVDTRIEERSVASFIIEDIEGVLSFQRGEPVSIFDTDAIQIFGGFIANPEPRRIAPAGGLYHDIQCMDNHYLADKRRIAKSYTNKTCGFIVDDIYDDYLAPEGVGIGSIEAGPTLLEAIFNYVRASDAYDALAEKAGKIWYIDEAKDLYFVDRDVTAAPWNLTDNDRNKLKGSMRMPSGNSLYRNRQYVRGGRDITGVQTETFTADGDMVAFTVGYPINAVPTVKEDGGAAKDMGIKGIDEAKDYYWSKGDPVVVAENAPANGVVVTIEYEGQYDVLILVTNKGERTAQKTIEGNTTTGFVDDIADETKLDDKDAMFDSGKAKLAKYGVNSRRLHYQTVRTGLRPGQLQTVTDPTFGLVAEEMLIEAVTFIGQVTQTLHAITAIQGPTQGSWARYFKGLASQKDEVMEKLNVGVDQLLIILIIEAETWEWSESISETVYACPVVALDLYPALTLFPC